MISFGRIKVNLYFNSVVDDFDVVTLHDRVIEIDETQRLYRSLKGFPKFSWNLSPTVKGKTNGRLNIVIIVGAVVYYTKLNWLDLFRLKWMFAQTHFQKHWEFWVKWIVLPALSLLFAERAGILDAISELIRSILKQ